MVIKCFKKCEGIVIRTTDYGESNKIVTIYTREWEKWVVMARGAKKPNSRLSFHHPAIYIWILFYAKQDRNGHSTTRRNYLIYASIREDIFTTAYASYIVELTDKATEKKKPNPFLFELLHQTIHYMNEGYDPEILNNIYEMKMLNVLGLHPTLNQCAVCGTKKDIFIFPFEKAGLFVIDA